MLRHWQRWHRVVADEWRVLALLALVGGAAWLFVVLAGEVMEGETRAFDRWVLLSLRQPADLANPVGPPWLEESMRDISALGSNVVLALMTTMVCGFLLIVRRRREMILLIVAVTTGTILCSLLKIGFDRPRPDLVPYATQVFTRSFPSGHSMMAAVVYLTLAAIVSRGQTARPIRIYMLSVAVVLSVLIGTSRIYLGVHWPTDVLGGWAVGAGWALLCWAIALWLERRGGIERSITAGGAP
jgi:undecaprenyl-diphosphatase